ncbi:MAG TPA: FimV/HubP family polar landmark protein [Burkholderiaceae bacterium]|nr:FimV/HubP family polar landmark protein [Burkholderiaceae bacterium]
MRNQTNPSRTSLPLAEKFAWRTTALAAALGIALNLMHVNANALSLGAMTSLSSLGESLAAGIAISEADAKELESLKLSLATPAEYSAMGMEYNSALASAQITLMRRANGSAYLLIRSDKVVNDPFVNVIVQANWAGGRIVRNYTVLIDPPVSSASSTSVVTTPIAVTATAPVQVITPAPISVAPANAVDAKPQEVSATAAPTPAPATTLAPAPVPANVVESAPATKAANNDNTKQKGEQLRVKQGDTAGSIASQNLPINVSLDQMLVALLRGNPKAFEGNNVNRLKAGAILELPNAEDASKIEAKEARQNILAQSKDFKTFRRTLAGNATSLASQSPDRQSGGKIDAVVEDRKAATTAPDKLTLSKANMKADVKGVKPDESAKIAKERQAAAEKARAAELNKNIADLNAVATAATAATAAKPATAKAPETTLTPTIVATAPTAPTVPATAAAAPSATSTPVTTDASKSAPPAANAPVKPVTPLPAPVVPEPSFMDDLMANPMILPATGGLLALLAGWGLYKSRQRKNRFVDEDFDDNVDNDPTIFNITQMDDVHDSVKVNTPVTSAPPAPPVSPVAIPVVTPIAKIQDLPGDVDIKLDNTAIATAANIKPVAVPIAEVKASADQTQEMSATTTSAKNTKDEVQAEAFPEFTPSEFSVHTIVQVDPATAKSPTSVDLDLDFDFAVSGFQKLEPEPVKAALFTPPEPIPATDVQKKIDEKTSLPEKSGLVAAAATVAAATTAAVASVKTANAPMDFNLDGLSLDLNANNKVAETAQIDIGPLETKLALAKEFRAIGDISGARVLVQEVVARATGSLKSKAESFLTELV